MTKQNHECSIKTPCGPIRRGYGADYKSIPSNRGVSPDSDGVGTIYPMGHSKILGKRDAIQCMGCGHIYYIERGEKCQS